MLENKKVGIVVNILLAVIVLSFLIWGLHSVISLNNEKNENLQALGYNEDVVYNRTNYNITYGEAIEQDANEAIGNDIQE